MIGSLQRLPFNAPMTHQSQTKKMATQIRTASHPSPLTMRGPKEAAEGRKIGEGAAEEEDKSAENEGLPGVESHIGSLVVAPDGQEEDGRDGREVGERADGIVRETGFFGFGHELSLSGAGEDYRWRLGNGRAVFLLSYDLKEPGRREQADSEEQLQITRY